MPLPFDATLKDLVQAHARDWLAFLDEPPAGPVRVLTPDLSTLTAFTDVFLEVGGDLIHVDFQSGPDPDLAGRILLYNVLLHERYARPVHSLVLLLRPRADRSDLTGSVSYAARPGRGHLDFGFQVVRLWQQPAAQLLAGGLGTLPLAPLGQMPAGAPLDEALPAVIARLVERVEAEVPPEEAPVLLTAAYVLAGLRVSRERAIELFQGVRRMRESSTYQAILDEGRAEGLAKGRAEGLAEGLAEGREEGLMEGRIAEARGLLLRLGRKHLGAPDEATTAALQALTDLERIERLTERVTDVKNWQELFQTS